jgi:hypothetical protein
MKDNNSRDCNTDNLRYVARCSEKAAGFLGQKLPSQIQKSGA